MSDPKNEVAESVKTESRRLSATGPTTAERATDIAEPAQFRLVLVSFLAGGVGLIAGVVAYGLYRLIGLFTNIFFFHRWSADFTSSRLHTLGPWVIITPVIGGIIVGFMAKYGNPQDQRPRHSRSHGSSNGAAQPDSAARRDSQADFSRHRYRHRRTVRRGRPDQSKRRSHARS
jgi:hypothetical protein